MLHSFHNWGIIVILKTSNKKSKEEGKNASNWSSKYFYFLKCSYASLVRACAAWYKIYKPHYLLIFFIAVVVTGCNSAVLAPMTYRNLSFGTVRYQVPGTAETSKSNKVKYLYPHFFTQTHFFKILYWY